MRFQYEFSPRERNYDNYFLLTSHPYPLHRIRFYFTISILSHHLNLCEFVKKPDLTYLSLFLTLHFNLSKHINFLSLEKLPYKNSFPYYTW